MSNELEIDKLLSKLESEPEAVDVAQVASVLGSYREDDAASPISLDEVYSLLFVLGKTKDRKYLGIIEKFLNVEDPTTVRLALEILCRHWGLSRNYFEYLLSLSLGAAWDPEGDVRSEAITILSDLVASALVGEVTLPGDDDAFQLVHALKLLTSTLEATDNEQEVRAAAYQGLLQIVGTPREEIPTMWRLLDPEYRFDLGVSAKADALLARHKERVTRAPAH